MLLQEIKNPYPWSVQLTHAAVSVGSTIYEHPRSFKTLEQALAYMIQIIERMIGELDPDVLETAAEDVEMWIGVTVDDLIKSPNFGAYHVDTNPQTRSKEYWYALGFVDGDVLLTYGTPEPPNREEIQSRVSLDPKFVQGFVDYVKAKKRSHLKAVK